MLITSEANPHIKYLKRLARRRFREEEEKFIIEGVRFVEEAVSCGWSLETVVYTPRVVQKDRGKRLLDSIAKLNIPTIEVTEAIFSNLSFTVTPQGVLAVVKAYKNNLTNLLQNKQNSLFVMIDGIQDPGNLGTIIRIADAAGAAGVILAKGTVDLYNPKTLRATMGSIFHLPVIMAGEAGEVAEGLLQNGVRLVVGIPQARLPVYHADLTGPVALVVGSEANGVSEKVKALAEYQINIPMPGRAESLNAAAAAAIMCYEAIRQRLSKKSSSDFRGNRRH
ncbi:TrmH family RNA methyltransferase [Desulfolucanica intricata]|uniref:TrmH family RNA methyltransferase n=1 Tax=Desulfolucanica intricata TaxID=1285191 RepID=UPI0008343FB0|nr:RNA methyltransferase [Desulfolucanica intricata]